MKRFVIGAWVVLASCTGDRAVLVEELDGGHHARTDAGRFDASAPWLDAGFSSRDAAQPRGDAGGGLDAAVETDGGFIPDAGMCESPDVWVQVPIEITSVELLNGARRAIGITERLAVTVRLQHTCDFLPGVQVTVNPGNATDFVELAATAFTLQAGCPAALRSQVIIVTVPGEGQSNLRVVVGWEGGEFMYDRRNCEGNACSCSAGSPRRNGDDGSQCSSDCDCRQPFSCLARQGPGARCGLPCQVGLDCLPFSTRCVPQRPGSPPLTCDVRGDECSSDVDCPVDFVCLAGSDNRMHCVDQRSFPGGTCRCAGDCVPGDSCQEGLHPFTTCERPCNSARDCPQQAFVCHAGYCRLLE